MHTHTCICTHAHTHTHTPTHTPHMTDPCLHVCERVMGHVWWQQLSPAHVSTCAYRLPLPPPPGSGCTWGILVYRRLCCDDESWHCCQWEGSCTWRACSCGLLFRRRENCTCELQVPEGVTSVCVCVCVCVCVRVIADSEVCGDVCV